MEPEGDSDTNCNWCTQYSHQKIGTETRGLRHKRRSGDHPNYSIVEIGQTLRRVLETCCHSDSREKPSTNADLARVYKKREPAE